MEPTENKTRAQPNWVVMQLADSAGTLAVVADKLTSKAEAEGYARQLAVDNVDVIYSVYRYGGSMHAQRQTKTKVFTS